MHRTMISRSQGDKLELDLPPCNLFNHTRAIPPQQLLCETPFSPRKSELFARGLRFIRFPPQFIQLPDTVGLNLFSRP